MAARATVTLCFYAALREAAGRAEERVETSARTAAELYDEAAARHGFRFQRASLRAAVNEKVEPWSTEVHTGDTVVFLAPFAGG